MRVSRATASAELDRIRASWPGLSGELVGGSRHGFALHLRGAACCCEGISLEVGADSGNSRNVFKAEPQARRQC